MSTIRVILAIQPFRFTTKHPQPRLPPRVPPTLGIPPPIGARAQRGQPLRVASVASKPCHLVSAMEQRGSQRFQHTLYSLSVLPQISPPLGLWPTVGLVSCTRSVPRRTSVPCVIGVFRGKGLSVRSSCLAAWASELAEFVSDTGVLFECEVLAGPP